MEPTFQSMLTSWLTSNGGKCHPSVDPFRQLPGSERGIFATVGLRAGTQLMSVPTALCLNIPQSVADTAHLTAASSTTLSKAAVWLSERVGELGQFLACVLLLMAEIAAADASFFAPEIAALPASHNCLLAWTPREVKLLLGGVHPLYSPCFAQLHVRHACTALEGAEPDMRVYFKERVVPLLELRRDLWPEGSCGYEAMLQSAGMVQSRTFHINQADWATGSCLREGEDLYLIPVIDMANHSTLATGENAELQIAAVPAGQNTGDVSNRSFVLVAKRDIVAGEEIRISYGQLSDAEMLQTYGFLEPLGEHSNVQNRVVIRQEDVYDAGKTLLRLCVGGDETEAKVRWEKLEAAGVVIQSYIITSGDLLPESLVTTVMAMGLEEDAWEEYLADAPSSRASCEQNKPAVGYSGAAGHSPSTAAGTIPTLLCLGVDYLKMLIAEGDGCEAVLVLERLLRVVERRNPLHVGGGSPTPAGVELDAIMHRAPPESPCDGSDVALSKLEKLKEESAYREWCANRVAAGELSIIQRSLAMVVELRQAAEEAQLAGTEGSDESCSDDTDNDSPALKRHKA